MKTFRYGKGHVAGSTVTIGEFIDILTKFPKEMPLLAEWEGCHAFITSEDLAVEKTGKGHLEDECECLIINVNNY